MTYVLGFYPVFSITLFALFAVTRGNRSPVPAEAVRNPIITAPVSHP